MIKYLLLHFYLLSQHKLLYYFAIINTVIITIILTVFSYLFIKDIKYYLDNIINIAKKDQYYNIFSPEYIELSSIYKIKSLKQKFFFIFSCFIMTFILLFLLRYLRLGHELHVDSLLSKISHIPFLAQLLLFLIIIIFILMFKAYLSILMKILYIELKKLHIYLYYTEFYETRYYFNWFCKHIFCFSSFLYSLFLIYDSETDDSLISYQQIKDKYEIPWIMIPLFHFSKISKFKHSFVSKIIQKLAKYLADNFWFLLNITPFILIGFTFIFEWCHGLIKYTYYVIFFMFLLKIFLDLSYFHYHTNTEMIKYICVCYYLTKDLLLNDNYSMKIRCLYEVYTFFEYQKQCDLFLQTGLNWHHTLAILKNETWPGNLNYFHILKIKFIFFIDKIMITWKFNKISKWLYP